MLLKIHNNHLLLSKKSWKKEKVIMNCIVSCNDIDWKLKGHWTSSASFPLFFQKVEILIPLEVYAYVVTACLISLATFNLRGYCTSGPYFWRLCAFSQKIKQLWTKYCMDLVRNIPRNSKITVLLQWRSLLWNYSEKCVKINIFHVLSHKSITTWGSKIPVQY